MNKISPIYELHEDDAGHLIVTERGRIEAMRSIYEDAAVLVERFYRRGILCAGQKLFFYNDQLRQAGRVMEILHENCSFVGTVIIPGMGEEKTLFSSGEANFTAQGPCLCMFPGQKGPCRNLAGPDGGQGGPSRRTV